MTTPHGHLTPKEYAFATTPALAEGLGLSWNGKGYGCLFCKDDRGQRFTLVTEDVDYVLLLKVSSGRLGGLTIPERKFPIRKAGWPDEWRTES
jgi:hypothetical protein